MTATQPALSTAGARHRRVVRPAVLVAVLLGLFLMHGGPAAADGGCHGAMADAAAMHPAPATAAAQSAARSRTAEDKATARADETMRGALCLATPPRSGIPLPPLATVALFLPAAVLLPQARGADTGTRRRGPPTGGRELLLQACIART
ncbi:hypothetical protein [Streptomyces guryensis]|uniref:Uncharacterized protein n=1 Tax=Streptomyces guryensis TaxID=2886947 RepID=A0A9Q3VI76_9ACTN|nr:hypothetical protein [Streptomyces guryensis]MCD9872919.1 hypothetical protein [Streptomyces guryensis]